MDEFGDEREALTMENARENRISVDEVVRDAIRKLQAGETNLR